MKELFYLNKYFYQYRWRLLIGFIFVALSNYFRVLQPQVIRQAMDLVVAHLHLHGLYQGSRMAADLQGEISGILIYFGALTLLFALLMGLFMYFMRQTIIVVSRLIERDLRSEIFRHYQKLDLAFYRRSNTGDLMARITEDVSKVRMYVGPALMYGVNLVVLCVMVIYAMLNVSVTLTLYALIPLPILSISIYYVNNIINRRSTAIQQQLSKINSLAQEVYSGVRVVKAYAQEKNLSGYFGEACEEYKERNLALARVDAFFRPLMLLLIGTSTLITIYVGGLLVIAGDLTAGNIAEFVIYVNMLTWPVTSIGWVASIIQQAAASQKRINEFLKRKPEILDPSPLPALGSAIRGDVEFRDVSFTYPDTGIEALKSVSFSLKAGQKLAILGRTGSGKTTLADLLLRMYDPQAGSILVDGRDLRTYPLAELRRQIGYVPQDVFLFSDTVANNIAFAQDELPREAVERYSRYAAVHADIQGFPEGFDTLLGERGVTLSGGQKQRVSIARALVKEPPILLFDDCLSAVDTKTEAEIAAYMREVCADRSLLLITHRLYRSLQFDYIIVLDEGRIVEQGNHETLMQLNGYYAETFRKGMEELA